MVDEPQPEIEQAETASDGLNTDETSPAASSSPATPGEPAASGSPAAPGSPVAAALAELDTLSDRELAEHPDVYQRIHAELQSALSAIDDA